MARVSAAFYGLFSTLCLCAFTFACGERSTGLAGSAGRKDSANAGPATEASSPPPVENADKQEAKVERPASRPEATQASSTKETNPTTPADDEAADEDLRIIPPEVVSGAYLTCTDASSIDAPPPPGYVYYGCSALDADGERIDLSGARSEFALRDPQGAEVKAAKVVVEDRDDDVIWQVLIEDFMRGVTGLLTVYDADGKPLTIATDTDTYDTILFQNGSFGLSSGREPSSSSAQSSAP